MQSADFLVEGGEQVVGHRPSCLCCLAPDLRPASCLGSHFGKKGQRSRFQHCMGPPSGAQGLGKVLCAGAEQGAWPGGR